MSRIIRVTTIMIAMIGLLTAKLQIVDAAPIAEWQYSAYPVPDVTGNGHDLLSEQTYTRPIIDQNAAYFDGVNDALGRPLSWSPELAQTGDFTISTWINLEDLAIGNQDTLISTYGASGGGYQLGFRYVDQTGDPVLAFSYKDQNNQEHGVGDYYNVSPGGFGRSAKVWNHVTVTYSHVGTDSLIKIYIDGKLLAEGQTPNQIVYDPSANYAEGGTNSNDAFNGMLADTKIFSGLLSDEEIRANAEYNISWKSGVDGVGSDLTKWQIEGKPLYSDKVPSYSGNVNLPDYSTPYEVTNDVLGWEVNNLSIGQQATANIEDSILNVAQNTEVNGTLRTEGGQYTGDTVNINSTGLLTGRGSVTADITNGGIIRPESGHLSLSGNISNSQLIECSGPTNSLELYGQLTINEYAVMRSINNGKIDIFSTTVNNGLIESINNDLAHATTFKENVSGNGTYSLRSTNMVFEKGFDLGNNGIILDNNEQSHIFVHEYISKLSMPVPGFEVDNIELHISSQDPTGENDVQWVSDDRGATFEGLDDNTAWAHLYFGDDLGDSESNIINFTSDTILYCYGITIFNDAILNLNGATIYYLLQGYEYNNITGAGFDNFGSYYGGEIIGIPAIPEPSTLILMLCSTFALLKKVQKR